MGGTKYLKMPTDFFENEAIDFLLSQKQGTKYVTLYIMLCLKSLNTNGSKRLYETAIYKINTGNQ